MRWEFTGETKEVNGTVVKRIRAKKSFSLPDGVFVKKGEVGGWIERESNLCDNAWVCDNALVRGHATVCDNATVCGHATVCDNAMVCGYATVRGYATVCDNALVCDNAE